MKKCFRCHVAKPLSDFYTHPETADGRLGKCKTCNKADTDRVRRANLERYREYDRKYNKR